MKSILLLITMLVWFYAANTLAASQSTTTPPADDEEKYIPIPELNYNPNPPKQSENTSIFDDVRLHAGAAYLNSFQNVPLGNGQRVSGGMGGVQFNFGVDLFDPHWILQGALFSLPQSTINQAQISSNGFEVRMSYEGSLFESVTMHGGLGIESRNYSIQSAAGNNSMSSGATVLSTGIDYWPALFISTGLEFSAHIPLANGNDPSSYDLGIRVNGHF